MTAFAFGLAAAATARPAAAASDAALAIPDAAPIPVVGGEAVGACGFPTVAALVSNTGICTGTLIHPRVVATAAHCADDPRTAVFGESISSPSAHAVEAECMPNPGYSPERPWENEEDYGFCVLAEPIDLPITPVLHGCEADLLVNGAAIVIAGFGITEGENPGTAGRKHWVEQTVATVAPGKVTVVAGAEGKGSCGGDSGGPGFIRMADGSLRTWGMVSAGSQRDCLGTGAYARLDHAIAFIEENSGFDVTPCTDPDGTWNPGPRCGGFSTEAEGGSGTWGNGCQDTPATGLSSACGAAFDPATDAAPPVVAITHPADGDQLAAPYEGGIQINATEPDGFEVASVWISIDGAEQNAKDLLPPYGFDNVAFPEGTWTIVAHAEDLSGNVGASAPVTIHVGTPASDDGSAGGEDSGQASAAGDESSDGDGSTGTPEGDGRGGGCRAYPSPPAWTLAGVLLLALRQRRRG